MYHRVMSSVNVAISVLNQWSSMVVSQNESPAKLSRNMAHACTLHKVPLLFAVVKLAADFIICSSISSFRQRLHRVPQPR